MHGHKFTEIFWGIDGECIHTVNGQEQIFSENDLILLRSNDIHELTCNSRKPFSYYLICFQTSILNRLLKRYFSAEEDIWGMHGELPLKYHIPPLLRQWLNAAISELIGNPDDLMAVERFLLNLLFEIRKLEAQATYQCPPWLQETLRQALKPENFQHGSTILADLSQRSYEHVSRVLKQHTGLTPSEYINNTRIEYAAAQLALTDRPIIDISDECGFASLGRFYNLFKKRYKMPPRKYRLQHRRIIPAQ